MFGIDTFIVNFDDPCHHLTAAFSESGVTIPRPVDLAPLDYSYSQLVVYDIEPNGEVVLLNQIPPELLPGGITVTGYNPQARSLPGEPGPLRFLKYSNWMTPSQPFPDVYDDGIVIGGKGWHQLEQTTERFRWVENDAQVVVLDPVNAQIVLQIELEPGPGVGSKPFTLKVLGQHHEVIAAVEIKGRQMIDIPLTLTAHQIARVYLHVDGGGLPTPNGDTRILNFRIFKLKLL